MGFIKMETHQKKFIDWYLNEKRTTGDPVATRPYAALHLNISLKKWLDALAHKMVAEGKSLSTSLFSAKTRSSTLTLNERRKHRFNGNGIG